jgi:hypothetical protein
MKEREERETKFPQKQGFTPSFRQKKKRIPPKTNFNSPPKGRI